MEVINFQYVQEEYEDGELYLPRKEIILTHNQEEHSTISEVVDAFKEFLVATGYLQVTVDKIEVRK